MGVSHRAYKSLVKSHGEKVILYPHTKEGYIYYRRKRKYIRRQKYKSVNHQTFS